jgi:hypothetical protein
MGGSCWAFDSGMPPELRKCVKQYSNEAMRDYDRCLLQDCGGRRCPDGVCFYGDPTDGAYRKHPPGPKRRARAGRVPLALAAPHHARRIPRRPRRR